MRSSKHEALLNEILREGDYASFREELLKTATAEYRRVHRRSPARYLLPLAASLALLITGWSILHKKGATSVVVNPTKMKSLEIVSTKRLGSDQLVSTGSKVTIIETPAEAPVPLASDADLAASLDNKPMLLAKLGADHKALILLDSPSE